ncbi:MAG: carbohydrate binding domain-containing protein [Bacteroidia bacterium]
MKRILTLLSIIYSTILPAQIILNGSFEMNTAGTADQINLSNTACNEMLRDVHSFGSYGDVDIISSATYGAGPQHGKYYLGITGGGTDIISLTLSAPLITGKIYSVSYYDRKPAGYNVYPLQVGLSTINNNTGPVIYTEETASSSSWTQHTFTFTAPNNGRFITVQMIQGSIGDWLNIDNFVLNPSRCGGEINIRSSSSSINLGSPVNFTVLCNNTFTLNSTDVVALAGYNTFSASPTSSTVYSLTSQQKDCPALTATITIDVIIPVVEVKTKDTVEEHVVKAEPEKIKKRKKIFHSHRVNGRKFIIQESITVSTSQIKIQVWDKNKVDGDMVSLYLNGELIEKDFIVSKTKKEINVDLLPGKNIIVMHALNLGLVPPNTAALSINDGGKPKLITLISNLKKSGALEIVYDPIAFSGK